MKIQYISLLCSWHSSHYSAPIHWLVHGHMASNNKTVYCKIPWAGNIAKTMTSNGKQFTVTRQMLTAVARDPIMQLKVAWCCRWNLNAFLKICFCFYHLWKWSVSSICFAMRLRLGKHQDSREYKTSCFHRDHTLSICCHTLGPLRNLKWIQMEMIYDNICLSFPLAKVVL